MPPKGFRCKRCGKCCNGELNIVPLSASDSDIQMWLDNGRDDILDWVAPIILEGVACSYDIWIDPESGEEAHQCPWLVKSPHNDGYQCRIQDVKPEVCREFPTSRKHAEKVGCSGFRIRK